MIGIGLTFLFSKLFSLRMKNFFEPNAVAILGASSKPGKIGYEVLKNLIRSGFKGRIYPINLTEENILGLEVFKRIGDVHGDVELAVFVLPSTLAPQVMEECGRKGVKRVVVISGGFKELDNKGAALEERMVDIASKYGIRIIGPNCIGIFDGKNRLDTFFQPHENMVRPKYGNIAILTQSGTYGASLLEWFYEEQMGVSKFVSYGNKCDVNEVDMLKYLKNDDNTKVIVIYVEGFDEGRSFLRIAKLISTKKPIVLLKSGRSKEGAKAAKSHTGALSGDDRVFTGAMAQAGIIVVDNLEEMLDAAKILSLQPLPKGGKIGMVTNGAGPCVVAVDNMAACENLEVAKLKEESIECLRKSLPSYFVFDNPIDVTGSGTAEHYDFALKVLAQDPNVDILLPFFVFQDAPLASTIDHLHKAMNDVKKYRKTLIGSAAGGPFTKEQGERFQENNIPFIPTANRVISALDKIVRYSKWLRSRS